MASTYRRKSSASEDNTALPIAPGAGLGVALGVPEELDDLVDILLGALVAGDSANRDATLYPALIQQIGIANAKATKIGLKVIGEEMPTHEEIRDAVAGRRTVIRLRPR